MLFTLTVPVDESTIVGNTHEPLRITLLHTIEYLALASIVKVPVGEPQDE